MKKNKKNIWTRLPFISEYRGSAVKDDKKITLGSDKKGSLDTQWNVQWNITKIQYLTPWSYARQLPG